MAAAAQQSVVQQQDSLRSVRNFVSLLSGATSDQTWAGEDGYAVNNPRQYMVQGPNGIAIEGQPVVVQAAPQSDGGGFPPLLIVGGLALVALLLLK